MKLIVFCQSDICMQKMQQNKKYTHIFNPKKTYIYKKKLDNFISKIQFFVIFSTLKKSKQKLRKSDLLNKSFLYHKTTMKSLQNYRVLVIRKISFSHLKKKIAVKYICMIIIQKMKKNPYFLNLHPIIPIFSSNQALLVLLLR